MQLKKIIYLTGSLSIIAIILYLHISLIDLLIINNKDLNVSLKCIYYYFSIMCPFIIVSDFYNEIYYDIICCYSTIFNNFMYYIKIIMFIDIIFVILYILSTLNF